MLNLKDFLISGPAEKLKPTLSVLNLNSNYNLDDKLRKPSKKCSNKSSFDFLILHQMSSRTSHKAMLLFVLDFPHFFYEFL